MHTNILDFEFHSLRTLISQGILSREETNRSVVTSRFFPASNQSVPRSVGASNHNVPFRSQRTPKERRFRSNNYIQRTYSTITPPFRCESKGIDITPKHTVLVRILVVGAPGVQAYDGNQEALEHRSKGEGVKAAAATGGNRRLKAPKKTPKSKCKSVTLRSYQKDMDTFFNIARIEEFTFTCRGRTGK